MLRGLGKSPAMELVLTGGQIGAQEAVARVYPDAKLVGEVVSLAK